MSADCDIFSDSYGCVFTDCEGYQTSFAFLRLGNPRRDGVCELKSIASSHSTPPSHRLLTLCPSFGSPCRSFLEILSPSVNPIVLHHYHHSYHGPSGVRCFRGLSEGHRVTAVVSCGCGSTESWSANFLTTTPSATDGSVRQSVVPTVHSVAVVSDTVAWCLHGTENRVATLDPELLLSAPPQKQRRPPVIVASPPTEGVGHVCATGEHTAAVFHSRGVLGVDRRDANAGGSWRLPLPPDTLLFPGNSCGAALEHLLVCCTADGRLLVYDQRKAGTGTGGRGPAALLLHRTLGAHVSVRAWLDKRAVLLVTADQVGVLDTRSMSVVGALQQSSDGDVCDATLLSSDNEGHALRICTSALNGMIYFWRMSF